MDTGTSLRVTSTHTMTKVQVFSMEFAVNKINCFFSFPLTCKHAYFSVRITTEKSQRKEKMSDINNQDCVTVAACACLHIFCYYSSSSPNPLPLWIRNYAENACLTKGGINLRSFRDPRMGGLLFRLPFIMTFTITSNDIPQSDQKVATTGKTTLDL